MAELNHFHVFDHESGTCLIVPDSMHTFDLDSQTLSLIKKAESSSLADLTLDEINILESLKLVKHEITTVDDGNKEEINIMKVALFLTQDCNFRCVYCYGAEEGSAVGGTYGSRGKMSSETAFNTVDWLMKQSGDDKKVGIVFFGGEPFMNFPVMKQVVEYADKQAKTYKKSIDYSVTTNGSLLNQERINFLRDHNIYTTVSMDGGKKVQDQQRPLPDGKGSYDVVEDKVRSLLKVLPNSSCRGTIFDETDAEDSERSLRELGFKTIYLTVASPSLFESSKADNKKNNNKPRFQNQYIKAKNEVEQIREALINRDSETLNTLKETGTWAKKIIRYTEEFSHHSKRKFPCGAGRHYVGVSSSGEVYPCHRLVGTKTTKLGEISDKTLDRTKYHQTSISSPTKNNCSSCFAKNVCAGGCHHDNMGATGDIHGPDEEMCDLIRAVVGESAALSSQLTSVEKVFLINEDVMRPKICPLDLFD